MIPGKLYLTLIDEPSPIALREISEVEFNGYKDDSETIRGFEYYKNRLIEIDLNKKSFVQAKKHYTELLEKSQTESIDFDFKGEAHVEFNRCFINFITSFKSLIEHCEKKIKCIYTETSSEFTEFKEFIRNLHHDSLAYKLADCMRNYAVHSTYPIDVVNFDVITFDLPRTDKMYEVGVFISKALILNSNTLSRKLKNHIEEMDDKIDIIPVLEEVNTIIKEILKKFISICKSAYIESANRLNTLLNGRHDKLSLTRVEQNGARINYNSILIPVDSVKYLSEIIG